MKKKENEKRKGAARFCTKELSKREMSTGAGIGRQVVLNEKQSGREGARGETLVGKTS